MKQKKIKWETAYPLGLDVNETECHLVRRTNSPNVFITLCGYVHDSWHANKQGIPDCRDCRQIAGYG